MRREERRDQRGREGGGERKEERGRERKRDEEKGRKREREENGGERGRRKREGRRESEGRRGREGERGRSGKGRGSGKRREKVNRREEKKRKSPTLTNNISTLSSSFSQCVQLFPHTAQKVARHVTGRITTSTHFLSSFSFDWLFRQSTTERSRVINLCANTQTRSCERGQIQCGTGQCTEQTTRRNCPP